MQQQGCGAPSAGAGGKSTVETEKNMIAAAETTPPSPTENASPRRRSCRAVAHRSAGGAASAARASRQPTADKCEANIGSGHGVSDSGRDCVAGASAGVTNDSVADAVMLDRVGLRSAGGAGSLFFCVRRGQTLAAHCSQAAELVGDQPRSRREQPPPAVGGEPTTLHQGDIVETTESRLVCGGTVQLVRVVAVRSASAPADAALFQMCPKVWLGSATCSVAQR